MKTLHWFFSLGTSPRPANYVLHSSMERFASRFSSIAERYPAAPLAGDAQPRAAQSATVALTWLLGPPVGVDVRFHCLGTRELEGPLFESAIEQAAAWARPGLRREGALRPLGARTPDTVNEIVKHALDVVAEGDAVFIDTTGGLRPFALGLTLMQPVLRALRPTVELWGAAYAELGGWPEGEVPTGVALSPVYDHTEFLDLPSWASAADDLRSRRDAAALARLLEASYDGTFTGHLPATLAKLAFALDLGWPSDMVEPLKALAPALVGTASASTPGQGAVIDLASGVFAALAAEASGLDADRLDRARLAFEFRVCRSMLEGGRTGDAIRVARETMVNAAVLARDGGASVPSTHWRDALVRREAEGALFRTRGAVNAAWTTVCELRNAASHCKTVDRNAEGAARLASPDAVPGAVEAAAACVGEWEQFVRFVCASPKSDVPVFISPALPSGAAHRAAASLGGKALPTEVRPAGRRGKHWAAGQAKRAIGCPDAILALPEQPGDAVMLAAALAELGVNPWWLHGDSLVPAFPGREAILLG